MSGDGDKQIIQLDSDKAYYHQILWAGDLYCKATTKRHMILLSNILVRLRERWKPIYLHFHMASVHQTWKIDIKKLVRIDVVDL